jgi:hypothetical protein
MTESKAMQVFEQLESKEFNEFKTFGSMSLAFVCKNETPLNYHIKIVYKDQSPVYILDKMNEIFFIYTRKSFVDNAQKQLGKGNSKLRLDEKALSKIDYREEKLYEPEHLTTLNNPCVEFKNPYNDMHDLLEGGIDVSTSCSNSGTLGGLFLDKDLNVYGISNAHVLKKCGNSNSPSIVTQPGSNGSVLSRINKNIGFVLEETRQYNSYSDSVVFKVYEEYKNKCQNSTRFKELEFESFGEAKIGDKVSKAGRSTHLTEGKVISTKSCTFYNNNIIFKDQLLLTCMAQDGDSGSLIVNEFKQVVGIIHSKSNTTYNFASKSKYLEESILKSNIHFKEFINQKTITMIKKINVEIGKASEHQLLLRIKKDENANDVELDVRGKFMSWKDDIATELKITDNDFEEDNKEYIFDVRFVNIDSCSGNKKCKELQLLTSQDQTLKKERFKINCDFAISDIKVVMIKFTKDEYDLGLHKNPVCSDCYFQQQLLNKDKRELVDFIINKNFAPVPIPTKKNGHILRGISA